MEKIALIIESLGSGGAERQLSGLAVMLKDRDYDVEVWYYYEDNFYLDYLLDNGISVRFLKDSMSFKRRILSFKKEIKRYKPDVVISYSSTACLFLSLLHCIRKPYRLIVSERNTTQILDIREKLRFFCYRWADMIVPNSLAETCFINNKYPQYRSKTITITNFVDIDRFVPSSSISYHKEKRIICVGRIVEQKNVLLFLKAVREAKQRGGCFKVDWYGQILDDKYAALCQQEIIEYGLEETFYFHKPLENIEDEYRSSDFFCLPSIYEGFPNVLCEAMSCGLPVMVSRVCDNPHIVHEGINGLLFDPLNVDEMAECILSMIKLPEETINKMKSANRMWAIENCSPESFIKRYINLIQKNGKEE